MKFLIFRMTNRQTDEYHGYEREAQDPQAAVETLVREFPNTGKAGDWYIVFPQQDAVYVQVEPAETLQGHCHTEAEFLKP